MTDAFSIGWTEREARSKVRTFKRIYAINLALQSLIAVLVIALPSAAATVIGVAVADAPFATFWAGMVLFLTALQVPLCRRPIPNRMILLVALLGRFGMAILFLSEGVEFWRLALFDAAFAAVLILALQRAAIAELQTRP